MRILQIIGAILAGWIAGNAVNMTLLFLGLYLIPLPEGLSFETAEAIQKAMPLLSWKHYVTPLVAHAGGTFAGALLATICSPGRYFMPAVVIGVYFLIAGIMMLQMIPGAPMVFVCLDIILAYGPMAWLGYRLVRLRNAPEKS